MSFPVSQRLTFLRNVILVPWEPGVSFETFLLQQSATSEAEPLGQPPLHA